MNTVNKNDLSIKTSTEITKWIAKNVSIKTTNGKLHNGKIFTVDPLSKSIILTSKKEDVVKIVVLLGHAIESIEFLELSVPNQICDDIVFKSSENISLEDLKLRQIRLKNWLEKNRIPLRENGMDLEIENAVVIKPPYNESSCISENLVVLRKFLMLLRNMPID